MRDPVDRVLAERAGLDRGFKSSVWLSVGAHFLIVGSVFGAQFVIPRPPPIEVMDGFAVVVPRGGGGVPDAPPPAPAPEQPQEQPATEVAPEPEPPPKVIKPPTPEREPERRGLPEPEPKPERRRRTRPTPPPASAGLLPGGTGTGTQTPGVEFAPAGPGIPSGVDRHGDWYLAGVQRKIWEIWIQQINADFQQAVRVQFTITADGSVRDVRVVNSSGAAILDLAAQRAVMSAAPFGAFPREYGGADQITIQANFQPNR